MLARPYSRLDTRNLHVVFLDCSVAADFVQPPFPVRHRLDPLRGFAPFLDGFFDVVGFKFFAAAVRVDVVFIFHASNIPSGSYIVNIYFHFF